MIGPWECHLSCRHGFDLHLQCNPPNAVVLSPVSHPVFRARNTTTGEMSFGRPKRPSGVVAIICSSRSLTITPIVHRLGARGCTADDGDVTTKRRCSFGLERHGWPAFRRRVAVGSERYAAVLPPSAANDAPVIKAALSDARNTMVWAISSGAPSRWSGTVATKPAFLSSVPVKRLSIPVSIGPGATALTRTPRPATSIAADLVSPSTACLLAA